MREIRNRSSYDIARDSAWWEGPYRTPGQRFANTLIWAIVAIVLLTTLYFIRPQPIWYESTPETTCPTTPEEK